MLKVLLAVWGGAKNQIYNAKNFYNAKKFYNAKMLL